MVTILNAALESQAKANAAANAANTATNAANAAANAANAAANAANAAAATAAEANAAAKAAVAASEAMVTAVIKKAGIRQKSKPRIQLKDTVNKTAPATASARAPSTASATESTNANVVDAACSICFDKKVDCSLNCGHLFCFECARHLNHCPTCRAPIRARNKIYL